MGWPFTLHHESRAKGERNLVSDAIETFAQLLAARLDPPARRVTAPGDRSALESIYARIGARFPALYEHLVLHYRWEAADLSEFELLANPGPEELFGQLFYDSHFAECLIPAGLVPFARPAGGSYDPICFHLARRRGHDCSVVRVDHENILSRVRVGRLVEVAPSFRGLATRLSSPG